MKPAESGVHSVSETPSGGRLSRFIFAAKPARYACHWCRTCRKKYIGARTGEQHIKWIDPGNCSSGTANGIFSTQKLLRCAVNLDEGHILEISTLVSSQMCFEKLALIYNTCLVWYYHSLGGASHLHQSSLFERHLIFQSSSLWPRHGLDVPLTDRESNDSNGKFHPKWGMVIGTTDTSRECVCVYLETDKDIT